MKMDKEENRKYVHAGLTLFLTAAAIIVFYVLLMHFGTFLEGVRSFFGMISPIINGILLAYLLAPIVNWIEERLIYKRFGEKLFKNKEGEAKGKVKKRVRYFSIFLTYLFFISIVVGLFSMVIPEIASNIQSIVKQFPEYRENLEKWASGLLEKNPSLEKAYYEFMADNSDTISEWVNTNVLGKANDLVIALLSGGFNFLKSTFNFIIGLVIAMYILNSKELFIGQMKKVMYALMKKDTANAFIHNIRFTNKTFMDFFGGKIVDSVIIGFLCFILTTIIGTPYALLVSVIVGVTNVIPFFGPFIGAIPSAILVLMVDPKQCLYFIIMILVLQQVDGNIIGPMILGSKTGLSSFWVIFSITLFGGLFGFPGMLIGVPVFAVLYTGFSSFIAGRLARKNIPLETKRYVHVDYIDEENEFVRLPKEEVRNVVSNKGFKKRFMSKHKKDEK